MLQEAQPTHVLMANRGAYLQSTCRKSSVSALFPWILRDAKTEQLFALMGHSACHFVENEYSVV